MALLQKSKGFTLIETLMAAAVLALAGVAIIGMLTTSFRVLDNAKRRLLAAHIAQEGMELFVSKRNNNMLCIRNNPSCPISDWKEDMVGSFEIDATEPTRLLAQPPGPTGLKPFNPSKYICVKASSPLYQFCPSSNPNVIPGQYTREVEGSIITLASGEQVIRAKSIVEWDRRSGGPRASLTLEKILFNTFP